MSKPRLVMAAGLAAMAGLSAGPSPAADALSPAVKAQVEGGKAVFEVTCATGMCHGAGGSGGRGPVLARRQLPMDLIRNALQNGRPNTNMPAFKDVFDAETQARLVAYVVWLSSDGQAPTSLVTLAGPADPGHGAPAAGPPAAGQAPASPWLSSTASSEPLPVGPGKGTPSKGVTVFFDATRIYSCRACHTYAGAGGPVGPDLSQLKQSPNEIFASLSKARTASAAFPGVVITLRDGSRRIGVRRDETGYAIRYFDVTSIPPVSRRVAKADIAAVTVPGEGVYDHTTLPFSSQELRDVSAFLGKTGAP